MIEKGKKKYLIVEVIDRKSLQKLPNKVDGTHIQIKRRLVVQYEQKRLAQKRAQI